MNSIFFVVMLRDKERKKKTKGGKRIEQIHLGNGI